MPDIRKEIIRPGTYTYLNPKSGLPERMTVTADTIKHFHAQGNAMLADGLSIPVPIEHQSENPPKPLTQAERAASQLLNNAGFVKSYEIKDDKLFGILDIPDPTLAKKLPQTVRSVSPWINSFLDGNGKNWQGVVSHVALTLRPRITKQANFETVGAAMSMVTRLTDRILTPQNAPKGGVSLSRFGRLKLDAGKLLPEFPIGFSLTTGVKLSAEDLPPMDDEDDDGEDDEVEDIEKAETEGDDANVTAMADDAEIDPNEESGDVSFEELIPHLLEMHGIHVPGGGRGREFLQALVRGLLASAKTMAKNDGGDDNTVLGGSPKDTAKLPGPVTQESPPMYMSLTAQQVQAIADPKEKQIAEAFLSMRVDNARLQANVDATRKHALDEAGKIRQQRIDRLLARLPASVRDKVIQIATSTSAQLSMGTDGIVRDPIALQLEAFEGMIADLKPFLGDGRFAVTEQPQPADLTQLTNEQAKKLADDMTNRRNPVPKSA